VVFDLEPCPVNAVPPGHFGFLAVRRRFPALLTTSGTFLFLSRMIRSLVLSHLPDRLRFQGCFWICHQGQHNCIGLEPFPVLGVLLRLHHYWNGYVRSSRSRYRLSSDYRSTASMTSLFVSLISMPLISLPPFMASCSFQKQIMTASSGGCSVPVLPWDAQPSLSRWKTVQGDAAPL